MSKLKRKPIGDTTAPPVAVTPSRDNVVTLQTPETSTEEAPEPSRAAPRGTPRSKGDRVRSSYHASLYLPEAAQFALREIALAHRKAKPHDVMLEAMAELFEKNGKLALAKECRGRITPSRDSVTK